MTSHHDFDIISVGYIILNYRLSSWGGCPTPRVPCRPSGGAGRGAALLSYADAIRPPTPPARLGYTIIYNEERDGYMNFNNDSMYHIGLRPSDSARAAIICGDPGRVEKIARLMDEPKFVASKREYTTWSAKVDGERVLVVSHGIGGPSTAICIEELHMIGVDTLIRVGTCGGMNMEVKTGDLVIAQAAIRAEGTSREYLPVEYPAVADFGVTMALREAAITANRPNHVGVVHCKDSFYGQHSPERMPVCDELASKWKAWLRGGCLASEMETAALFTVSATLEMHAGCVLRAVWNQERVNAGITDPDDGDELSAARCAILAVKSLLK